MPVRHDLLRRVLDFDADEVEAFTLLRELQKAFRRAIYQDKSVDAALGLAGRWRADFLAEERRLCIAAMMPSWDELESAGRPASALIRDRIAKAARQRRKGHMPSGEIDALAHRYLDASGGTVPAIGTINKALPLSRSHKAKPRDARIAPEVRGT
jgi:hypothetical protein